MKDSADLKPYACYGYARLSREDGDKAESDSIKNQRELIRDFVSRHPDLSLAMEGSDDGYTGTNFERPAFQEMLSAIRAGTVNCVIVKDLSRFGREYIGAGRYVERLFPALGVRFIAINDGYDSARADAASSLILPFKNLINDSYCRDTSIKIRSHFEVKRRNGEFLGSFAPYGYQKDPLDKNRLVPDEEAASVVRDLFRWKRSGLSSGAIAERLNTRGILSPTEYKKAGGFSYDSGFRLRARALWSAVAVNRILKNAVYLGVMEQGKRTTPNYKVKTVVYRPRREWVRVEDTHEALVSQADFELVSRLLLCDTRTPPGEEAVRPLAGLLSCGDCKNAMTRKVTRAAGQSYAYYICSGHKGDKNRCSPHSISAAKLEKALLEAVNWYAAVLTDPEEVRRTLDARGDRASEVQKEARRLSVLEGELAQAGELRDAACRRYGLGELSKEDFGELRRIFTEDCARAEAAIQVQRAALEAVRAGSRGLTPGQEAFLSMGRFDGLTRPMAARLFAHAAVYENGRVELTLRWRDAFLNKGEEAL